jgi:hypothetical protein
VDADAADIAGDMLKLEPVQELQEKVRAQLADRQLLNYELVDAYRWIHQDEEGRPAGMTSDSKRDKLAEARNDFEREVEKMEAGRDLPDMDEGD